MNKRLFHLLERADNAANQLDGNPITPFIKLLQDLTFIVNSVQNGYGLAHRKDNENATEVLEELRDNITHNMVTDHILPACLLMDYFNQVTELCSVLHEERV